MKRVRRQSRSNERGQSLLEFALVLPLIVILSLGVIEVGYALLDAHVVTRLAREGANLISRDASLQDAATAMQSMSTRPVDLNNGTSKVIFSVLRNIDTVGATNYNKAILYQRYEYGSLAASSKLNTAGAGSFGGPPEYTASNPNNNTGLRVTNLPGGMSLTLGGYVYVTEIYTRHQLLTPFNSGFGFEVPQTLYSIAYF